MQKLQNDETRPKFTGSYKKKACDRLHTTILSGLPTIRHDSVQMYSRNVRYCSVSQDIRFKVSNAFVVGNTQRFARCAPFKQRLRIFLFNKKGSKTIFRVLTLGSSKIFSIFQKMSRTVGHFQLGAPSNKYHSH